MGRYIKTPQEIRGLSAASLAKEIEEAYRQLFQLRLRLQTRQLQDHRQVWKMRRHLARLLSEQRARQLAREGGK